MKVNNDLEIDDVFERFPEVNDIEDPQLHADTVHVIMEHMPDYFWEVAASSSGKYHPEDHRGRYGLWLHTKRAFTEYEALARSYYHQGLINEWEMDCGRSAILLHDMFKYGWPAKNHTTKDHDVFAAEFLRENTDLPEEVIGCVETHNGPEDWGAGPAPRNDLEQVHHMADMAASRIDVPNIAVKSPSDTLVKFFGEENLNVMSK